MSTPESKPSGNSAPARVVIAGGGVAALEGVLALNELAGARLRTTVIAPNPEFRYRPMSVREPFAYAPALRFPVAQVVEDAGAELLVDSFAWVDRSARVVHTEGGAHVEYDALLLALGARAQPRYRQVVTVDDARIDDVLHGLIQDVEGGYVRRLAFVVPERMGWPLPIYELALMTAKRAYDMGVQIQITVVTPEETPLGVFGAGASEAVSHRLHERGVGVVTSAEAEILDGRHVTIGAGKERLEADRIVALPQLFGPSVRGLPAASHGFIPIDRYCRVVAAEGVYAAGDATDYPIKHGGLAAQQADTAAAGIAAAAGAPVQPSPFDPEIRGMLLTGGEPLYLSAHVTGGHGFSSTISESPSWSPPTKISARYLAPYLTERGVGGAATP